jgi:hypothetical protein
MSRRNFLEGYNYIRNQPSGWGKMNLNRFPGTMEHFVTYPAADEQMNNDCGCQNKEGMKPPYKYFTMTPDIKDTCPKGVGVL